MGYFSAGLVFTHKPDWAKLNDFPTEINLKGYEYKPGGVWMLDFWRIRRSSQQDPFPFCEGYEFPALVTLSADPIATRFDEIAKVFERARAEACGSGWIRLACAVAKRLDQTTFLFAADDDLVDFACQANPIGLQKLSGLFGFGQFHLRYGEGRWRVTPRIYLEGEEDNQPSKEVLEGLQTLAYVTVDEPVSYEGGKRLYENPLSLWPKEAGDPTTLLGLGSWDLFDKFEPEWITVFDRTQKPSVTPSSTPVEKTAVETKQQMAKPAHADSCPTCGRVRGTTKKTCMYCGAKFT